MLRYHRNDGLAVPLHPTQGGNGGFTVMTHFFPSAQSVGIGRAQPANGAARLLLHFGLLPVDAQTSQRPFGERMGIFAI